MATGMFHSPKIDVAALLYALVFIFLAVSAVGREAIAWLLMKLYEIFIQRNPVRI